VELLLGTMISQVLAFALLLFLLKKYAFGPLLGMMQKRQEGIENDINLAQKNREEADKLLKEQIESLKKAREEAHEIVERAKVASTKQAEEIVETARVEAVRLKDSAVQEIQLEKEKAVAALRDQIGTLSVMIATKVIEKEIDANAQSQLVDDMMKQVGESL